MKTYWVPVYECRQCGKSIENHDCKYNVYGMTQFPDVDAPESMAHKCNPGYLGLAVLVGLAPIKCRTKKARSK